MSKARGSKPQDPSTPFGFDYLYEAQASPSWEAGLIAVLRRYKADRDRWKAGRKPGDEEGFIGHPALHLVEQIGETGTRLVNRVIERDGAAFEALIATAALASPDGALPEGWLVAKLLKVLSRPGTARSGRPAPANGSPPAAA